MTRKPRIWKLKHLDYWMVRYCDRRGLYQLRSFRTWENALTHALSVTGKRHWWSK